MERLKSLVMGAFWKRPVTYFILFQVVLSHLVIRAIEAFYTHTEGVNWAQSIGWASLFVVPFFIARHHKKIDGKKLLCIKYAVVCFALTGLLYFRPTVVNEWPYLGLEYAGFCMPLVVMLYAVLGWLCVVYHQKAMGAISYATAVFGAVLAIIYGDLSNPQGWGVVSAQETMLGRMAFNLLVAFISVPPVVSILNGRPKNRASLERRQEVAQEEAA